MGSETLNICQVSLKRDIPLIIKNYNNFKKIYKDVKIYIICPSQDFLEFEERLNFKEIKILKEEDLISFNEFNDIFKKLSLEIQYKSEFQKRINWYYQQVLKISFVLKFIDKERKSIVIWDADTIILKKIDFFENDNSIMYGNFTEFHKSYFITNKMILKTLSTYYISFLNQFIAISVEDGKLLIQKLLDGQVVNISQTLSRIILSNIFLAHKEYNGSMFSEYELLGQVRYISKKNKQKPILFLRFGLNGILTKHQTCLVKFLNFKHVTYEHSHVNENSQNMLSRNQSWLILIKVIIKNLFKFYLRFLKHNFLYAKTKNEKN